MFYSKQSSLHLQPINLGKNLFPLAFLVNDLVTEAQRGVSKQRKPQGQGAQVKQQQAFDLFTAWDLGVSNVDIADIGRVYRLGYGS